MYRLDRRTPVLRMLQAWILALAALGLGSSSRASYSGLVLIPTADVSGAYTWVLDLHWTAYSNAFSTDELLLNTEFGIGERFEIGIDMNLSRDVSDGRLLLNAKYVLLQSERHQFALAAGIQNMNEGFTPYPFLVATKDWSLFRTHFGVQRESETKRTNWFVGLDRTFDEKWQVMADYTSGEENYASAGLAWSGKRWQFMLGAQWPNAGGPAIAVFHVVLSGQSAKARSR